MNERDVAEQLLLQYGHSRAYDYVESHANCLGLSALRIETLLDLAHVKVTWDE